MNFIRFYVRFPEEKMNLTFEKRVEEMMTNKNIPMGVEEIILEQVKEQGIEQGIEQGREKQLYDVARKMIIKGKTTLEICDLLEVEEEYILNIRKEVLG